MNSKLISIKFHTLSMLAALALLVLTAAVPAAATPWTEGVKTVLYMRVDFPDVQGDPIPAATAQSTLDSSVSPYFTTQSYNKTSLKTTVVPAVMRMPQASTWYTSNNYYGPLLTDARNAALALGYTASNYDLEVLAFKRLPGWSWAGLGSVGYKNVWLNGYFDARVTAHELGHNYGAWHAGYLQTTDGSPISGAGNSGAGTFIEYGNPFDVMGQGQVPTGHFNNWFKNYIDWIPASGIQNITTDGTYRIQAQDNPASNGVRGLKIVRDETFHYWIEFRQAFTGNSYAMDGAFINFGFTHPSHSWLLDMTPNSPDGVTDAPLMIGRTFSDPYYNIHITPIGKGGTSPETLDVVVKFGAFPDNKPPTLSIASSAATAPHHFPVNFTATASDADGDALVYHWNFGDRTFATGANPTKIWPYTGTYTVTCTVSDMKGGTASASTTVTVDNSTAPSLSINDMYLVEGDSGTADMVFKVTLSPASTQTVTANYATTNGTALAGTDYTAASGALSFAPGETFKNFIVPIRGDIIDEVDETFVVNLSGVTNAALTDGVGIGTIVDDECTGAAVPFSDGFESGALASHWSTYSSDSGGRISVTATQGPRGSYHVTMDQGNASAYNLNELVLSVDMTGRKDMTLSFWYKWLGEDAHVMPASFTGHHNSDGVAISADGVTWYKLTTPIITSPNGSYQLQTVDLDAAVAAAGISYNECFKIKFQQYDNFSIPTDGSGFDDIAITSTPELSINDVTQAEGDTGTTNATLTVSLSAASGKTVTVDYATADGLTDGATAGSDYTATTGTLSFAPGTTTKTITVPVLADTTDELNESFVVNLTNAVNATIKDNQGVGTIADDDGPTLAVNDVQVTEGNSGTTEATLAVTL
ncbi:MAG: PKD domain-containing protein, partial [Armatimonadota bacterium]|nr:PKD domain-containing protein [Armatimonadota bacterium]